MKIRPARHRSQNSAAWRRASNVAGRSIVLFTLLVSNGALSFERKDCEQRDSVELALRTCTALLKSDDLDRESRKSFLTFRGYAWLKDDEPHEAVADFTKAIAIDGADVRAIEGRARANTALGLYDLSNRDWSLLITGGTPEPEVTYFERGSNWLAAGNEEGALQDFAKILAINPSHIKARVGTANAYAAQGNRQLALEEYERAEKIDPSNPAVYLARAKAAESWGDHRMAVENYMRAVRVNSRAAWEARKALKRLGVDSPP